MEGITCSLELVTMSNAEFAELIRKSERIDAVERYINASDYPSVDYIKALLCIGNKEEKKAGEES